MYSSFQKEIYQTQENWKAALKSSEVRLQWDPDHDIYGNKEERRAIQIGLKGDILELFGTSMIKMIVDMTSFVNTQRTLIENGLIHQLELPTEAIYRTTDEELNQKLRI